MKKTLRLFDEYRAKKQEIEQKYNALKERIEGEENKRGHKR